MKKSIIYLGIALLAMTSFVTNAKTVESTDANQMAIDSFKIKGATDRAFYVAEETAIMNPEIFITADHSKSVEEVISADNQVTERFANSDLPAFKSKSAEETINADNRIIEAVIPPVAPLNQPLVLVPGCDKVTAAE
ncbi:MAG TPA: hypothetical protein VF676_10050 [Flavobacterium sp.]|jgi:hypothetical protein